MVAYREKLIVALDVDEVSHACHLAECLAPWVGMFKVGMQLFYRHGPLVVEALQRTGAKLFLDLKLHDIPRTVASASRALVGLGVGMFNVHATGGAEMMRAAAEAAREEAAARGVPPPLVLAVTVLTSIDEEAFVRELGFRGTISEKVVAWSLLAKECGLDGVVASAREAAAIRQACGPGFLIVTPGIRPAGAARGDQKRVATPAGALQAGATHLVVGRPVVGAADPVGAVKGLLAEIGDSFHVTKS